MFYLHLQKVFTAERCAQILAEAQAIGFEKAAVNFYGTQIMRTDIRQNSRMEWDNANLANELAYSVRAAAGDQFPSTFDDMAYAGPATHLRVYAYEPGDFFRPHRDGKFRALPLITRITVLAYLNDTDGGDTVLMLNGPDDPTQFIHVTPKVGDVLMFQHEMWHEGKPVMSGAKFVLRTDLFYYT